MAIVGSAHVVIRALTDKLQDDIQKGLQGAVGGANGAGAKAGRSFGDGFNANVDINAAAAMDAFENALQNASHRAGENAGDAVGEGISEGAKKGMNDVQRNAGGAGNRAGGLFASSFNRAGGRSSRIFVSMALRIAALLPIFAVLIGSIGAVVNGLFAMGAAAANAVISVTALAGALAAVAQGAIVGLVAFGGIGEAVSAGSKAAADAAAGASQDMGDAAEDAAKRVRNAAEAVADAERNAARAIRDALRAVRDAKENLAQVYIDTERAMRDAVENTSDAEEARLDAVEDLEDAQRALNDALEEAADRMRDLQFQSRQGAIAEQEAVLKLQDALYMLHATEALPVDNRTRMEAILAYQQAQLDLEEIQANNADTAQELASASADGAETISDAQEDVSDAQEGVSDATQEANDALTDQIALHEENTRAIRDAREALQLAQEALRDAYREAPRMIRDAKEALAEAKEAQAGVNQELAAGAPAADAFAEAMAKLSPAAQSFVRYLISIKGELQALKFAAQEGLFPGLETALRNLVEGPMFPALERMMFSTGQAIGQAAVTISKALNSGPFQESFGRVTEFNAKLIRQMGRIFGDLAVVIFRVLDAARPLTKMFFNWVEGLTSSWRETLKTKDGMTNLEEIFRRSGRTMRQLWRITTNLWEGFRDLGRTATPAGKSLLNSFENATKAFANFTDTKKKRQELREMFMDTADNLRAIGDLLLVIGGSFTRMGSNPAIARTMKELEPVIKNIEELMTNMLETMGTDLTELVDSVVLAFAEISESGALTVFLNTMTTAVNILTAAFNTPILGTGLKWLLQIGAAMYALSILRSFPGISLFVTMIGKTGIPAMIKFNAQMALLIVKTTLMTAATKAWSAATIVLKNAQFALAVAMRLNPLGLIITAITLVIGAFILLYRRVDWFRNAVNFVMRKVVDAFNWLVEGAQHLWDVLFGNSIFPDIIDGFVWFADMVSSILGAVVSFFTETIPNAAKALLDFFLENWPIILSIIAGPIGLAIALITTHWDEIKAVFTAVATWVIDVFAASWNFVKDKIIQPIVNAKNKLGEIFGEGGPVRNFFSGIKDWAVGKFAQAWGAVKDKIVGPVSEAVERIKYFYGPDGPVVEKFNAIKDWVTNKFSVAWNAIKGIITGPIEDAKGVIDKILGAGKDGIQTIFSAAVTAIGTIWSGLQALAKAPIKFIVNTVLNEGLFKAIGLLPGVGTPHMDLPNGFASGGVLPGYTPGRDVHQFYSPTGGRLALSGGEAIMRPEFTKAVGGERGVKLLNKYARTKGSKFIPEIDRALGRGYASGGVFPLPGGSVTNVHTTYGHYAVDINKGAGYEDYGLPVLANQAGRVTQHYRGDTSYGRWVTLLHDGGGSSLYAHLSAFRTANNAAVSAGTAIGSVGDLGNTGDPPTSHLHFELSSGTLSGASDSGGLSPAQVKAQEEGASWKDVILKFPGAIEGAINNIRGIGEKFGAWGSEIMQPAIEGVGKDFIQWVNDKIPDKVNVPKLPDIPLPDNPIKWPFDQGGVADGQGWMAKDTLRPERVLSPEQTELFDRMVNALERTSSSASGGLGNVNLDVHVPHDASPREVVDGIMYEMRRLERGGRYT